MCRRFVLRYLAVPSIYEDITNDRTQKHNTDSAAANVQGDSGGGVSDGDGPGPIAVYLAADQG